MAHACGHAERESVDSGVEQGGAVAEGGRAGSAVEGGASDASDGGRSPVAPRVCTIKAPTACKEPAPVYADVAPIFEQRCFACHGGLTGQTQWPLTTYSHAASWRDLLLAALVLCQMPPADSGLEIPDDESLLILRWIRCGMQP